MKNFAESIRTENFIVTAELPLSADSDAASIHRDAAILSSHTNALLVPDNRFGHVHMSSLAAAAILVHEGIDPILELGCRNRNRVALLGDLLGARALGIRSLMLIRGRKAPGEIESEVKFVLDIGAKELVAIAKAISDDPELGEWDGFTIGAVATIHDPVAQWSPQRLSETIDCGAQFIQTQLCFDANLLRRYMKRLIASRIIRRAHVMVSCAALPSADYARRLRERQTHIVIPDAIIGRLECAADPRAEGMEIGAELLREFRTIPGITGVNLVSTGDLNDAAQLAQRSKSAVGG